ncbi:transposase [Streptomyces sp. NPDC000927]|uniref:IS701 family transposase n=1 Tax=Streptomyces sp. NPDC000927 TaxID=3154371 RepID=UPI00332AC0B0
MARRTRLPGDEADPAYMRGLVSSLERKNARTVAEQAGHDRPDRLQQLLNTCDWDADEVRDDVREFVIGHLGDQDAVLVVDDTGFLKRGIRSAGVQRQYTGMAGRVENSQVGTFLAYATDAGHTLIDRELYLPASWTDDREHCRAGPPWNAASQHVQSRPSARPAWSGSRPRSGWAARQTGGGSRRLSADRRVRRCESGQARLATTPAADASVMGGCGGIGLGQVLATRV